MVEIYEEIAKIKAEGEVAALAIIISSTGSTPRAEGSKMLVRADGSTLGSLGGGELEARACKKAMEAMEKGKPERLRFSLTGKEIGMICGGNVEIFIEPIIPSPTLYIFGGGHIAVPLVKIGKLADFRIAVIDDRAEFANAQRFPEAELILVEDFSKVFSKLKIGKSSYLVIITRNHEYDDVVLELALATPAKYIGMIGSKTKRETIFSHMLAKGVAKELLDKVHAPIGLEINAETPEEIAVSILAEIIKVRRSGG